MSKSPKLVIFDNLSAINIVKAETAEKVLRVFPYCFRKKSGKIKSNYKREYLNTSCDIDFDLDGPVLHGTAVTE